jgi:hypothetical protein
MCKAPLNANEQATDPGTREILPSSSTVVLPNLQTQPGTMILGELVVCPSCSSINESTWAFCQQCGNKMDAAKQTPAPPEPAPPRQPEPPVEAPPQKPAAAAPVAPVSRKVAKPEVAEVKPEVKRAEILAEGGEEVGDRTIVMGSIPRPSKGRLRLIMENGEKGEAFDLRAETIIGRVQGDITFAHDGFMSGRHARIVQDGDDFVLHDEGSRNGVFVRIKKEVRLEPGDYILIGRQLFQFET